MKLKHHATLHWTIYFCNRDSNVFSHDPRNKSTALRSEDDGIGWFVKLHKIQRKLSFCYSNRTGRKLFHALRQENIIFLSNIVHFYKLSSELIVHRSKFSGHLLLQLCDKSEEKERRQSFWDLSDVFLQIKEKTEIEALGTKCLTHDIYE